ncbi:MAG: hypothetical protein D6680_05580 [Cyanobacteria bacterium J007]|nr:MAG: hypothetical protein D6680_05580 [Cyanobacteria bacterium J007]
MRHNDRPQSFDYNFGSTPLPDRCGFFCRQKFKGIEGDRLIFVLQRRAAIAPFHEMCDLF